MKRVLTGTCLAAAFAVGLAAQAPTGQAPSSQAQQSKDDNVTVTGCLKAGDQPGTFVLSNAKWDDKKGATPATPATPPSGAATGTAGSPAGMADTIKLSASGSTKLSEHVGHTIQVTGKIDSSRPSTTGTSGTGAGAGAGASSASRPQQTLNVDSVKMVSSTCSM